MQEARPEAVLDLLRDVRGETMSRAEYEWWFGRDGSIVNVAEEDGRLVGVAALTPARVLLEGEERTAMFAVALATRTEARGRGVFSCLQRENEERAAAQGAAAALCFANAASRRVLVGRLGWRKLGRVRVWARPLLGGREVGVPPQFEAPIAAPAGTNHIVRGLDYLRWRYVESPRAYAQVNGTVVGTSRRRGIPVATVLEGDPHVAPVGARLLLAAGRARGFVPTPWVLHLVGKELDSELELRSAWHVTLGDLDFL